ncbi:hypothetical protein [Roseivirga sp.]|uniref:hypothetical protein n=1 Tax=Roseivirga sp. TaxID=1964215 RepID=UPI003B8B5018
MGSFVLREELKREYNFKFQPYVYSAPDFLKGNNDFQKKHFYWVNESDMSVSAHLAFSLIEDVAYSPHQLPFGGIEFSKDLSELDLQVFLKSVESRLDESGVKKIRIHQAPEAYANQDVVKKALLQCDYEIIQTRIFHTIAVNDSDLLPEMHKMEQRKYKMCYRDGAIFREIKKKEKIEAFQWIERKRNLAYKPPSMSWVDLQEASQRNPKVYKVFGVFLNDWLLAATVLVVVNGRAVYHFMPASQVNFRQYKKYSPMVFLVNGLYNWCRTNGVEILDLGTSYVDMKMKDSLAKFKENTGGKPCDALSWQKTLSS